MRPTLLTSLSLLTLALALIASSPVLAEDDAPKTSDWRQAAKADGLTDADVERLARDKVLVGAQSFKQVFSPYCGCDLPLFITSDSILNAFHVVFEASLVELERARAASMAEHLAMLVEALPGTPKAWDMELDEAFLAKGVKRALTTVGVGLALLEAPLDDLPEDVRKIVVEEAGRVVKAEGTAKPAWLGPPDEGFTALDYSRFRPRGFYDRDGGLRRYFRAVSWLQAIPFRIGVEEEFLAALLLAKTLDDDRRGPGTSGWACRAFLGGDPRLWGPGDDAGLLLGRGWSYPFSAQDFDAEQRQWNEGVEASLISDQVAFGPLGPSVRILSASRLPDAVLFHRTTNEVADRALPTGLEVAAVFGSPVAREALEGQAGGAVAAQIERSRPLFGHPGLYPLYLRALGHLVGPPEPDAPALFSSRAWQRKSCHTFLAAWAQMRHTYVLHAKQSAHYLGLTEQEPGFVEPAPAFFEALREVVVEARRLLEVGGAFDTTRVRGELSADLRYVANRLEVVDAASIGDRYPWSLLGDEEARGMRAFEVVYGCGAFEGFPDTWDEAALQRLLVALRSTAAKLEDPDVPLTDRMRGVLAGTTLDLEGSWEALEHVLIELELLAHKQLRGIGLDEADGRFIESYGPTLAAVMFYGGNLWLTPRDDAPRIVDVASDPNLGRYLLVGVGRPRALYVLYPRGEEEILCRGAVMPYHELAGDGRTTDGEWLERLGEAVPPALPCLRPLLSDAPVRAPEDH